MKIEFYLIALISYVLLVWNDLIFLKIDQVCTAFGYVLWFSNAIFMLGGLIFVVSFV